MKPFKKCTVLFVSLILLFGISLIFSVAKAEIVFDVQYSEEEGWVRCLGFSNDGPFLAAGLAASGGLKRHLNIIDVEMGETIFTGAEHDGVITSVAWSPNDRYISTTSLDGSIKIWEWDGVKAEVVQTLHHRGNFPVEWSVFSPDGAHLYSYSRSDVAKWDTTNWRMELAERASSENWSRVVDISPDGKALAVIAYSNFGSIPAIEIWNPETFDKEAVLIGGELVQPRDIKWSPSGRYILVGGLIEEPGQRGGIVVWDVTAREVIIEIYGDGDIPFGRVFAVDWSPDGMYFGHAARQAYSLEMGATEPIGEHYTFIWDVEKIEVIYQEPSVGGGIVAFVWSPKGDHFALGTTSDRRVIVGKWSEEEL